VAVEYSSLNRPRPLPLRTHGYRQEVTLNHRSSVSFVEVHVSKMSYFVCCLYLPIYLESPLRYVHIWIHGNSFPAQIFAQRRISDSGQVISSHHGHFLNYLPRLVAWKDLAVVLIEERRVSEVYFGWEPSRLALTQTVSHCIIVELSLGDLHDRTQ
jgi:hypothetical protein